MTGDEPDRQRSVAALPQVHLESRSTDAARRMNGCGDSYPFGGSRLTKGRKRFGFPDTPVRADTDHSLKCVTYSRFIRVDSS